MLTASPTGVAPAFCSFGCSCVPRHRLLSNFSKPLEQAVQDQQLVLVWEFWSFRKLLCAYLGQLLFFSGQLEDFCFTLRLRALDTSSAMHSLAHPSGDTISKLPLTLSVSVLAFGRLPIEEGVYERGGVRLRISLDQFPL